MDGEYWFNSEPISKHIDIIFEYEKYQFINEVVHLCSIEELREIIHSFKKRIEEKLPCCYAKEYFTIRVDFSLCTIEYELPNASHTCYIWGDKLIEILEKYVYIYDHLEDRFKL